jgi:hypothetical protein
MQAACRSGVLIEPSWTIRLFVRRYSRRASDTVEKRVVARPSRHLAGHSGAGPASRTGSSGILMRIIAEVLLERVRRGTKWDEIESDTRRRE